MPHYIVKILKFDCVDESGIDWTGSDEPCWMFTANSGGTIATTRSKVFGDVDSGDTRAFATDNNRNTIWPSKGHVQGADGPIALSIQLWEIDQGNPDAIAEKTELALGVGGAVVGPWVNAVGSVVRGQMGAKTLLWSQSRLASRLPGPGSSFVEKHRFGGNSGDLPFEVAGGPDYDLYLQVTRLA
jgi:hypothetical protein